MDYEALLALNASLMRNVMQLTQQVAELEQRLAQASDNGQQPTRPEVVSSMVDGT